MSQTFLSKARRIEEVQPWGGQRLHRILGARSRSSGPLAALHDLPPVDAIDRHPFRTLSYLDATHPTPTWHSAGDIAVHVLWTAPGTRAVLIVGDQDAESIEYPCAPGDFLLVPAGRSWAIGAGILAVMVGTDVVLEGPGKHVEDARRILPPTHGLPVFSGFNRQTFGVATSGLALCRWKLTQPQTIVSPADRPLWLSNLVEPVAVNWTGGMHLLERTAGCFVAPGAELTVLPNDLGYLLVAWVPDLEPDVVGPLRSAGYSNADIAALGVPGIGTPSK